MDSSQLEVVNRAAAAWGVIEKQVLSNGGSLEGLISFEAFLSGQYAYWAKAGKCQLNESGFELIEDSIDELEGLAGELGFDEDYDDEDDEDDDEEDE